MQRGSMWRRNSAGSQEIDVVKGQIIERRGRHAVSFVRYLIVIILAMIFGKKYEYMPKIGDDKLMQINIFVRFRIE